MKRIIQTGSTLLLTLVATITMAHPGHGLGTVGHDLQHQLWIFGALIVVGAICMLAQGRNSDRQ
jgi:hypothetical protein